MSEIATFVFFDIETTGLPWQERNLTKIIEFSFVAASRKDLIAAPYGGTPKVRTLTSLLNPEMFINPAVSHMTGLTNELLDNKPTFKDKFQSIVAFFKVLPKPVCLVAHNGNTFDYKILLAECNDINASLPADLLCVDSLPGFRSILKGTNINYTNLQPQAPPNVDDLLTDDEDEDDWPDLNVSQEQWEEIDDICLSLSDISCEDMSQSEREEKENIIRNKRSEVIKKVFQKKRNPVNTEKECFNMSALYKRLLNKVEDNAHRAEVDCLMLAQCVVALKEHFLPWADENLKRLTEIEPLNRNYVNRSRYKPRQQARKPVPMSRPSATVKRN